MKNIHFIIMIVILLWMDLSTKWYMEMHLNLNQDAPVIVQWLSWDLLHNKGISFSFFSGYSTHFIIFVQIILVLILLYVFSKVQPKTLFIQLSFSLLISGALGNIVTRFQLGYVIDFISFRWWPAVFNIADVEIRTGVILLVFLYFTKRLKWSS